jgi:nitrate/TMAO reductase-like tetraheme cytochrome c subunit
MECHGVDEAIAANRYEGFVNTLNQCYECHEDIHQKQFDDTTTGFTDCARCHNYDGWTITDFDHDNTAFKLEGAHITVDCAGCHKPMDAEGEIITQYKFNSFECIDCHQ